MNRILIIEDEAVMRQGVSDLLQSNGYEALALSDDELNKAVQDLAALCQTILDLQPNLILLDINLPGLNGESLLKTLRAQSNVPVIMLTSSSSEMDEVLSMSYGADDYITKPYSPQILLLRIAAVLKRMEGNLDAINFRGLRIDLSRGVIEGNSKAIDNDNKPIEGHAKRILLTKNEMIILSHLLSHQGKIVTRDALMTDLWNNHEYINDNALTVNISRVRAKLKLLGAADAIETRKGLGYILQ